MKLSLNWVNSNTTIYAIKKPGELIVMKKWNGKDIQDMEI